MTTLRKCRVCGLEAHTEDDLEKFKKRTGYPHNRLTICKECNYKGLKKPPTPYLRKCRLCGLEAHSDSDLIKFTSHHKQPYGKDNLCKKCGVELKRRENVKIDELLPIYRSRSEDGKVYCYFCDEEIVKFSGLDKDAIDGHSLDRNHNNWDYDNKVPSHRSCHGTYHAHADNTAQYIKKWREENKC